VKNGFENRTASRSNRASKLSFSPVPSFSISPHWLPITVQLLATSLPMNAPPSECLLQTSSPATLGNVPVFTLQVLTVTDRAASRMARFQGLTMETSPWARPYAVGPYGSWKLDCNGARGSVPGSTKPYEIETPRPWA